MLHAVAAGAAAGLPNPKKYGAKFVYLSYQYFYRVRELE